MSGTATTPANTRHRVVLHFDYDCFYAQVVTRRARPPGALNGRCVGVAQKSILATCNYAARRRGVRKMMRIADARRVCPDIVIVRGEDLSPFRDASKALFTTLARTLTGTGCTLERLGLDEIFVDATPLVAANAARIAALAPVEQAAAVFYLRGDRQQAEDDAADDHFTLDARTTAGYVLGSTPPSSADDGDYRSPHLHLRLGSHLAAFLRHRLARNGGYTASAGIATNKVLAKLAGKQNKPANQTTLLSSDAYDADNAGKQAFLDALPLRSVPGIGSKTTQRLTKHLVADAEENGDDDDDEYTPPPLTVADVRTWPGMSAQRLDTLLHGDGSSGNLPSGARVWQLLHGIDDTPVRPAGGDGLAAAAADPVLPPLPTQISIEDTYEGPRHGWLRPSGGEGIGNPSKGRGSIAGELRKLATSLLRRMHVDLTTAAAAGTTDQQAPSWRAHPRTLRLSLAASLPVSSEAVQTGQGGSLRTGRISRSAPLPGFVLGGDAPAAIVDRLVRAHLLPLFWSLAGEVDRRARTALSSPPPDWSISLLNVCVANMAVVPGRGGGGSSHGGSDIAALLRRQGPSNGEAQDEAAAAAAMDGDDSIPDKDDPWDKPGDSSDDPDPWDTAADDSDSSDHVARETCSTCGRVVPPFARAAHARYHLLGD